MRSSIKEESDSDAEGDSSSQTGNPLGGNDAFITLGRAIGPGDFRNGERQYIQISDERLDLADGDVIFYFTYAATDLETANMESAFIKEFEQKPIWQSLGAAKADKAYFVPGYWWRSQTYLLANLVIDDLFTHLTDTTATTPILEVSP